MAKSASEKMRDYRIRQKGRGYQHVSFHLDKEVKQRLQPIIEETGSYNAAIKKLLDHANSPS